MSIRALVYGSLLGVLLGGGAGCRVARPVQPSALAPPGRVVLHRAETILLRQISARPDGPGLESQVRTLRATLTTVNGDTLVLGQLDVRGVHALDTRWRSDLPSYVILAENPGLNVSVLRISPARSAAAVVLVPAALAALYFVFHMATFSPDAP
jgi:hypothetical protein